MTVEQIFEQILKNRGISKENREAFLNPNYDNQHDPFLLPDMEKRLSDYLLPTKNKKKLQFMAIMMLMAFQLQQ